MCPRRSFFFHIKCLRGQQAQPSWGAEPRGEKGPYSKDSSRVAGADHPSRRGLSDHHHPSVPLTSPALCKATGSNCFILLIASLSNYSPVGSGKPKPHLRLLIRHKPSISLLRAISPSCHADPILFEAIRYQGGTSLSLGSTGRGG